MCMNLVDALVDIAMRSSHSACLVKYAVSVYHALTWQWLQPCCTCLVRVSAVAGSGNVALVADMDQLSPSMLPGCAH